MDQNTIILNLLTLIPALVQGVEGAVDTYKKFLDMYQNGVTDEKLAEAVAGRDAILMRIVEKTEAKPPAPGE